MEYDKQEVRAAQAHGFRRLWEIFESYVVKSQAVVRNEQHMTKTGQLCTVADTRKEEERVILAQGSIARVYAPIMHPDLPNALAKIRCGDEVAARDFVQTYGLLGYERTVPPMGPGRQGEPLSWIWTHAKAVLLCLRLTHLLQEGDIDGLEACLQSLRGPHPFDSHREYWPVLIGEAHWQMEYITWPLVYRTQDEKAQQLTIVAHNIRRTLINENIRRIHVEVHEENGQDQPFFVFNALYEMIYWHLADALGKNAVRRCAYPRCQALFIPKRANQAYCPPRWRQKESPCAVRHRVEKHRSKQPADR